MSSILDKKELWEKVFPAAKGATARTTFPPFWVPKVGESLTGQIIKVSTSGKTGKNFYTIATESEDGKSGRILTLPAVTTVYAAIGRANEEYKGDVGVGSIVYIKYHGKKVSKKGYEYRNFEVFVSPREVAKQIMEDKGIDGWEGEISDDDVKRAEAARAEWQKRVAKEEENKDEAKDEPTPEKKPKKEKKEEKEVDPVQEAKDEIEKMCVAFPRFPVATVEKILKSTGVDMEAEQFLSGMGIDVEDGNVLRPD